MTRLDMKEEVAVRVVLGGLAGGGGFVVFVVGFFSVPSAAIKADATKKGEVVNSTGEKNKNNI